jgi:tight adherence protein B
VTAALGCLATALLLWPDARSVRRRRLGTTRPVGGTLRGFPGPRLRVPLAAAAAGLAGGLVGTPLVAALAAGCAGLAARAWVAGRRGVREEGRLLALAEALAAFTAELRSGRTREAAVAAAVTGTEEDLGRGMVRAVLGAGPPVLPRDGPVEEALARIAAAVGLSARTGASLDGVVTAVEDDLRARHRLGLELRSAVAGPRASALLLAGLPVLGLAMGSGVGADPWSVLTRTGTGQVLLVAGVGLEVAGIAWTRRLVDRVLRAPGAVAGTGSRA